MTPTEIRAELEQLAATGCTAADLDRLNDAWLAVRAETPESYHAVIDDRLRALRIDVDLPELLVATETTDFTLHELNGYWHWYSCGPVFGDNYCSEDGFDTQPEAIADATDFLASIYNSCPEDGGFNELPPASTLFDIELAETSPYRSGVHFALYECEGQTGVHWQGLCQEPNEAESWWGEDDDFAHLASDRGYFNARLAAADCIFCLHTERGYSVEAAVTLVYELALPVHEVIAENKAAVTAYIEQLKAAEFTERWNRLYPSSQQEIESALEVLPAAARDQARYEMTFRTQPMPEQYWPVEA